MSEKKLRELAQALCDKLRIVHASEEYKGIWGFAHTHGLSYDGGPTYVGELSALDDFLHGEGKEPPEGLFHGPGLPKKEPPTAEWEEWLDKCPFLVERAQIKKWFREMPKR